LLVRVAHSHGPVDGHLLTQA